MAEALNNILGTLSDIIWGNYVLVPLLLLTGIFLTILFRGFQFRQLGPALNLGLCQLSMSKVRGEVGMAFQ